MKRRRVECGHCGKKRAWSRSDDGYSVCDDCIRERKRSLEAAGWVLPEGGRPLRMKERKVADWSGLFGPSYAQPPVLEWRWCERCGALVPVEEGEAPWPAEWVCREH